MYKPQNTNYPENFSILNNITETIKKDFSEVELKNFLKNFIFILKRNFSQENLEINKNNKIILKKDGFEIEFLFSLIYENYILKKGENGFFIKSEEMNNFSSSEKNILEINFEKNFLPEENGKIKILALLEVDYIDESFEEKVDLNIKNFEDLVLDYYLEL